MVDEPNYNNSNKFFVVMTGWSNEILWNTVDGVISNSNCNAFIFSKQMNFCDKQHLLSRILNHWMSTSGHTAGRASIVKAT